MSITVRFTCGHGTEILPRDTGTVRPACPTCGETRVRHTVARAPNFRGVASGPSARTEALGGVPLQLAPDGPLRLKETS